ncbi:MAG: Asp-tRNA(Asn)/Glu-tRNA(Gln) amidotransferase subunit GatC, partial [Deltaproteobacteria bacterium]
ELTAILGYVDKLRELPTDGVPPTSAVTTSAALRDDVAQPSLSPEAAVKNAPSAIGSAVLVPKIME